MAERGTTFSTAVEEMCPTSHLSSADPDIRRYGVVLRTQETARSLRLSAGCSVVQVAMSRVVIERLACGRTYDHATIT